MTSARNKETNHN